MKVLSIVTCLFGVLAIVLSQPVPGLPGLLPGVGGFAGTLGVPGLGGFGPLGPGPLGPSILPPIIPPPFMPFPFFPPLFGPFGLGMGLGFGRFGFGRFGRFGRDVNAAMEQVQPDSVAEPIKRGLTMLAGDDKVVENKLAGDKLDDDKIAPITEKDISKVAVEKISDDKVAPVEKDLTQATEDKVVVDKVDVDKKAVETVGDKLDAQKAVPEKRSVDVAKADMQRSVEAVMEDMRNLEQAPEKKDVSSVEMH